MKIKYKFLLIVCCLSTLMYGQDDNRQLIRGQVIYRGVNVPNENVINITSEKSTITDADGRFAILAQLDDEIAFTAVNYELLVLKITADMLRKNRIVVEVNEKITALDEVVVSPEDQAKFIQLKNEEFKEVEYEIDRTTEVENIGFSDAEKGMMDGVNFVNIFKALMKMTKKDGEANAIVLKPSEVLQHVYDKEFFVVDLKLPEDKINDFLLYCDYNMNERSLLKQDNEFQLIEYLVNESRNFRNHINDKK